MKVLIIGAGRMGQRHAAGAADVAAVNKVTLADISADALQTAKNNMAANAHAGKYDFKLIAEIDGSEQFDIGIIAATAQNRIGLCELAVKSACKFVLVEKPLGQSMQEVKAVMNYFKGTPAQAYVNLNMRVYPDSLKLKKDLNNKPQLAGKKVFTVNTGTVGIGANGIHYLDYLFFLTDADRAEVAAAEIDETMIPSARGPQFKDFGGWCAINLFKSNERVARAYISVNPESTVFGGWDIVCPHGRITINESNGKRMDYIRKADSEMPIQRYNADYETPVETGFDSPFLGDLTRAWIEGIGRGEHLLPSIEEALPSHKLMFDWLSHSKTHSGTFPIT